MSSIYTNKESNIRKTWALFFGFLVFVIGAGWIFSVALNEPGILYFAVVFSLVMNVLSYWYSDKIVLSMARAKPVLEEDNPELYRIVENLAITAGLPTPKIYITPEAAPNAFATGRNPEHAVIAVTEGILNKLDRSELEGVLAHEMSHIGNRDMLLSTAVVVLVGFISIISDIFFRSMFFGRRNSDEERGGGAIIMVLAVAFSFLAPIAATIMQLAISRKREFLADSSGALLTRYPEGLARALEKISSDTTLIKTASNTTAHLWFSDPFKEGKKTPWLHKLFMTHPPVEERVRVLRGMKI